MPLRGAGEDADIGELFGITLGRSRAPRDRGRRLRTAAHAASALRIWRSMPRPDLRESG